MSRNHPRGLNLALADVHIAARIQKISIADNHHYHRPKAAANARSSSSNKKIPPQPTSPTTVVDLSGSATGNPPIIDLDRKLSASIRELLPLVTEDIVGPLRDEENFQNETDDDHDVTKTSTRSATLQSSLIQLSEMMSTLQRCLREVRKDCGAPLTIDAADNLLGKVSESLFLVNNVIVDEQADMSSRMKLLMERVEDAVPLAAAGASTSFFPHQHQPQQKQEAAAGPAQNRADENNKISPSRARSRSPPSPSQRHQHQHHHHNTPASSGAAYIHQQEQARLLADTESELVRARRELYASKKREEILLKTVRDLEIDVRVKSHIVSDQTIRARAVFEENSVLREISSHNETLLREIDSLKNCIRENEVLRGAIDVKDRTIQSMNSKEERQRRELRCLRNRVWELGDGAAAAASAGAGGDTRLVEHDDEDGDTIEEKEIVQSS